MGYRQTAWAWEQDLPSPEKFTLVALADSADNDSGLTLLGQETIARMTGVGVRSVRRYLTSLETKGFITRTRRHRGNGSRTSDETFLQYLPANLAAGESDLEATGAQPRGQAVAGPEQSGEQSVSPHVPPGGLFDAAPPAPAAAPEVELLACFNDTFGTRFRTSSETHLKKIRAALKREGVDVPTARRCIAALAKDPWWQGKPDTVNVVFGVNAFGRVIARLDNEAPDAPVGSGTKTYIGKSGKAYPSIMARFYAHDDPDDDSGA